MTGRRLQPWSPPMQRLLAKRSTSTGTATGCAALSPCLRSPRTPSRVKSSGRGTTRASTGLARCRRRSSTWPSTTARCAKRSWLGPWRSRPRPSPPAASLRACRSSGDGCRPSWPLPAPPPACWRTAPPSPPGTPFASSGATTDTSCAGAGDLASSRSSTTTASAISGHPTTPTSPARSTRPLAPGRAWAPRRSEAWERQVRPCGSPGAGGVRPMGCGSLLLG
mmetsp:Transcript_105285/g.307774  ORF Transcript_105285/g.307774 Transcript_105285/m.307774 type:complete len:223 (+) Transcript_105285:687-1355(+)